MQQILIGEAHDYNGFGKCLKITNGIIEALVTLDVGPRVIRFGFKDKENMFCEDTKREMHAKDESFDVFGENDGWYSYGGHRLWTSPEAYPRTYYPDNTPVKYEIVGENSVCFTPDVQKYNQYQCSITLSVTDKNEVTLSHKVTNCSGWDIELSVWPITVLAQNGLEVMSQPNRETHLLPNRIFAVWPYTKMNDERLYFGDKFITLRQSPDAGGPLKIGMRNEKNYAAYFNHDCLFVKTHKTNENGTYPDGGMSFETYTNPLFLEMETLSELKRIKPGESLEHTEKWALYDNVKMPGARNEEEIENILKNYVEI